MQYAVCRCRARPAAAQPRARRAAKIDRRTACACVHAPHCTCTHTRIVHTSSIEPLMLIELLRLGLLLQARTANSKKNTSTQRTAATCHTCHVPHARCAQHSSETHRPTPSIPLMQRSSVGCARTAPPWSRSVALRPFDPQHSRPAGPQSSDR